MAYYRCILPLWAKEVNPEIPPVVEGEFNNQSISELNNKGYNIYYLPNSPSIYAGGTVSGSDIDIFKFVFVDMDLKEGKYASKQAFLEKIKSFPLAPSKIVDSGNGIHVYWRIKDLEALSYLKIQRRLIRTFNTDEAVSSIFQLMRVAGTINTKDKDNPKLCKVLKQSEISYSCEELDKVLPIISPKDEEITQSHYKRTYEPTSINIKLDDKLPGRFLNLLRSNNAVRDIWSGTHEDRSKADFRLGNLLLLHEFTQAEAMAVLVNTPKAMERMPIHRVSYAKNIVDKIWPVTNLTLHKSVKDILSANPDDEKLKGRRFYCHPYMDNTVHGFRIGQVLGLVAGSGVGKTAIALNMFKGFVENNPDYDHFFIPLEQPAQEIALRWKKMCGKNEQLYDKVQILSNYEEDGTYRDLTFKQIRDYIIEYQASVGRKVGCVVIDHIGVLAGHGKKTEQENLIEICKKMKDFAQSTQTMLVMQSQAPREKAGIGDIELDKSAAYGTVFFESYCDYLVTVWQPLKRCYVDGAPTVTAYKFCKIRHKNQKTDGIKEDTPYLMYFEPDTETLIPMTDEQFTSFSFFAQQALDKRNDGKSKVVASYLLPDMKPRGWTDAEINSH